MGPKRAAIATFVVLAAACNGTAIEGPSTSAPSETRTLLASETPDPTVTAPESGPTSPRPSTHRGPAVMPSLHRSVDGYPKGRAILTLADGDRWDIPVLVATTAEELSHGLMEVPDVPAATGMVFVFDDDRSCCFWMKGTETDLDIAWFTVDGTVVSMTTMTVCRTPACASYRAAGPYRHALEVRAGWLAEIGLEPGDRIELVASSESVRTRE